MIIDNEGIKEIISNGVLSEFLMRLEIANKHEFGIEIDDEGGVHRNDGLNSALGFIGAVLDIDDDGYAVLTFDDVKWEVRADVKVDRRVPDFRKETLLYFDEIQEITR